MTCTASAKLTPSKISDFSDSTTTRRFLAHSPSPLFGVRNQRWSLSPLCTTEGIAQAMAVQVVANFTNHKALRYLHCPGFCVLMKIYHETIYTSYNRGSCSIFLRVHGRIVCATRPRKPDRDGSFAEVLNGETITALGRSMQIAVRGFGGSWKVCKVRA
ncbi:hypothetical protein BD410DRAFT_192781 [Rickenella mellea]|uniref:Uncharacterized protein n=1 Tax=Rickenella mellea TaxID=50990 RepID=A0A4Y7PGJ2_9AGAM|nr:hypothetical protein BD410DRAFT_192781 [Rickenella mellea]